MGRRLPPGDGSAQSVGAAWLAPGRPARGTNARRPAVWPAANGGGRHRRQSRVTPAPRLSGSGPRGLRAWANGPRACVRLRPRAPGRPPRGSPDVEPPGPNDRRGRAVHRRWAPFGPGVRAGSPWVRSDESLCRRSESCARRAQASPVPGRRAVSRSCRRRRPPWSRAAPGQAVLAAGVSDEVNRAR